VLSSLLMVQCSEFSRKANNFRADGREWDM